MNLDDEKLFFDGFCKLIDTRKLRECDDGTVADPKPRTKKVGKRRIREELDEEAGPTAPVEKKYKLERSQRPRETYDKLFEESKPDENQQNEKVKFNRKTGKFVSANKGNSNSGSFDKGGKRFDKKPFNDKGGFRDRKPGAGGKPGGFKNRK